MTPKALIVMAKRPFPGKTKTRLTPPFSKVEAARLYACFLRDVLDLVRDLPNVTQFIAYAPPYPEAETYFNQLAPDFQRIPQSGMTLGERLDNALLQCLQSGFGQVVAMNSDSPTLPADYLIEAFDRLDDRKTDVVLGPCEDGGYYLIGWKRPYPRLVCEVQMSTTHVLKDTLAIATAENIRVSLLPTWYDVDDVAELSRLQDALLARREIAKHTHSFLNETTVNVHSGW